MSQQWHPGLYQRIHSQQDQGSDQSPVLSIYWGHTSNPMVSFGFLTARQTLRCWSESGERHWSRGRVWSTSDLGVAEEAGVVSHVLLLFIFITSKQLIELYTCYCTTPFLNYLLHCEQYFQSMWCLFLVSFQTDLLPQFLRSGFCPH